MVAVGYAVMPVIPSFEGLSREIDKQISAPLSKASKQAGDVLEKGVGAGIEQAGDRAEKAQYRVKKATQELEQAQSKVASATNAQAAAQSKVEAAAIRVTEAQRKQETSVNAALDAYEKLRKSGTASAEELAAAEQKITAARSKGQADVASKEAALESARGRLVTATQRVADAQHKLASAEEEHITASGRAADAAAALEKAQANAGRETEKAGSIFERFRDQTRKMGDELDETVKKSNGFGSKIMDGLKTMGKGALMGVGAKIGTGVMDGFNTAVSKGFDRMRATETAQAKLKALGNDANDVASIMDNALASVKGTAFGIGEAAGTASTLVAAGIKPGQELQGVLDSVAASAAVAGTSMDEMGLIFGKAAAKGKLDGEVVAQLLERQIPIYDILSEKMGVASADVADLVSKGKVDFQTFSEAMSDYVGDGARVMADTFDGSLKNMYASLGRFGEGLEKPLYAAAPALFKSVTVVFDDMTAAIQPAADRIGQTLTPALESLGTVIQEKFAPFAGEVAGKVGDLVASLTERAVDPQNWERLGDVFAGMRGTVSELWPSLQSLGASFLTISKNISVATWEALTGVLNALAPLIQSVLVPLVEKTAELADQHPGAIQAIVTAFLGFKAVQGMAGPVVKLVDAVGGFAKAAAPVMNLLRGSALLNPWVLGIAALAGAVEFFFTKTETGRKLWGDFTSALSDGVDVVQEKFGRFRDWWSGVWDNLSGDVSTAWNSTRDFLAGAWEAAQPAISAAGDFFAGVWNGLVEVGKWAFTIITTMVLTPLVLAWEAMSWAVQAAWVNIIKPTWDALAAGAQWMWSKVLMPTFDLIKAGFSALGDGIMWVWENVIKVTWDALAAGAQWLWQNALQPAFDGIVAAWQALGDAIQWTWENIIKPVWDAMSWAVQTMWDGVNVIFGWMLAGWQALGDGLRWVYDNVIQPVWDAFGAGLTWLYDNVVAPVTSWIGDKWRQMGDGMNAVKDWIVAKVFGGLKSGLDTLQGWVQTGVDAIGSLWRGLKRLMAEPINFVINTVYNNGIKKVFDGVAEKVGLDARLPEVASIGGYARGGVLPGYTPGRDVYDFYSPEGLHIGLSGGEAIMRPEWVAAMGRERIDRMNAVAAAGGRTGVERVMKTSHFAKGGIVSLGNFASGGYTNLAGALSAIQASHGEFVGRFFPGLFNLTSASRSEPGSYHDYAIQGATDWQATDGQFQTQMPTAASKALARAIYTNLRNSAELIHYPLDGWENIKDGAPLDYGPATNSQHGNHVHWATRSPLQFNGDDIVLTDVPAAGGGMSFNPVSWFEGFAKGIMDKLPKFELPGFGEWAKVPEASLTTMFKMVKDWAIEQLKEWGKKFLNFIGVGGHIDPAQLAEMATEALRRMGYGPEYLDAMLQQIQIESGGDPNAVNDWDSNAAAGTPSGGLLQVIEPTYRDVRARWPEAFEGLPDDRMHPMTNLVAGVGAVKRDWGGPGGRWPTTGGYASGGVLPGYTPGRDVHSFFSPTGGALHLSGGEAIMVPEWTRAVGGPAAVAAMNKAARAGRTSGGPGFADGGVFGAAGGRGLNWDGMALALRGEEWTQAMVDAQEQLAKIADYNSLEGQSARAFATEMAGIVGMLGGKSIQEITTTLVGAEKDIWDARQASADRMADVAAKEKALEEARKAAADAQSSADDMSEESKKKITDAEEALNKAREDGDAEKVAEAEKNLADVRKEVSEKSAEDVTKANEQVAKAEQELAAARRKSAQALDIRIYDLAPQVNGMLEQAAAATVQVPAVSQALASLAAAAGPAGITVGVALQYVKSAIQVVQKVGSAIGDFVGRIFDARAKVYANMVQALQIQHDWAKMVDDQAAKVAELRVAWVEAQVALRDATWKTRLAQADVVRAHLQGVKSVAEAEAKLAAERKRVARAAMYDFDDLSLAYDRYRWAEYKGMADRLDLYAQVTPEILALEAEVNVAKLNALAAQKEASLGALQASWEQQKAALALMQTQQQLALQTQQLALMQQEFFGYGQAESLQAMNTMKLRQELSEVQSQQGKNFWRLSYWLTGAHRADNERERALREQIAEREGAGAGVNVGNAGGLMSFFGYGDSAMNAAKNAGYGQAERAMFEANERQQLLQIEQQKQQLEQQIEQSKLFEQYQKQIGALTAEIESLKTGASAAQYTADYFREENPAVKAANLALARFEADRSAQYAAVGRGEKQVVDITIPEQDVYTREQMDAVLSAVQEIPELEARIRRVETPAKPGANAAIGNLIGGY